MERREGVNVDGERMGFIPFNIWYTEKAIITDLRRTKGKFISLLGAEFQWNFQHCLHC